MVIPISYRSDAGQGKFATDVLPLSYTANIRHELNNNNESRIQYQTPVQRSRKVTGASVADVGDHGTIVC